VRNDDLQNKNDENKNTHLVPELPELELELEEQLLVLGGCLQEQCLESAALAF
jgi:hypothetical protein